MSGSPNTTNRLPVPVAYESDIGVDVPRQAAQPGFDRVDGFADGGEAAALDDTGDGAQFVRGALAGVVPHGDGGGQVAEGDVIAAEGLQRQVGVRRLVFGVGVDQRRRLVGQHLAQQSGHGLSLGEPLPAQFRQRPGRLGLVEAEEAGHPAVFEAKMVEAVEDPRPGQVGKTQHRQRADVPVAQHRL